MGDVRKWEDLPVDCLVDIFARVGVVSLVEDVQYVCKSWYDATLSPLCWKSLLFPALPAGPGHSNYFIERSRDIHVHWSTLTRDYAISFVKFVIRRSSGSANVVAFPHSFPMTEELLSCISEGCPSLKRLVLPHADIMRSSLICKWKNLEALEMVQCSSLQEIILEINVNCKKFISLTIVDASIDESEATAMVTLLPNIEFLSLKRYSWINRSSLVTILKGCRKLVHFDVGLMGYDVDDEIVKLAAHIASFRFDAAKLEYSDAEYDDYGYYSDFYYFLTDDSDDGYDGAYDYTSDHDYSEFEDL